MPQVSIEATSLHCALAAREERRAVSQETREKRGEREGRGERREGREKAMGDGGARDIDTRERAREREGLVAEETCGATRLHTGVLGKCRGRCRAESGTPNAGMRP
jgi:hypothetical protein